MINLIDELDDFIKESGYTAGDVDYIGLSDGSAVCSYYDFRGIADFDYNDGYGDVEINPDLVVRFKDGGVGIRVDYDGSEWWRLIPARRETDSRMLEKKDILN